MDPGKLWSECLQIIKNSVDAQSYESWFEPVECISYKDGEFVLNIPSAIFKEGLLKNHRRLLFDTLAGLTNMQPEHLSLKIQCGRRTDILTADGGYDAPPLREQAGNLNPKYTFENFVVGSSNQFTHAACMAVAESPGKAYNPLFIYGGVGLGKTHLMQAIGWFLNSKRGCGLKIAYVSCETFTNELINAIHTRNTQKFRAKFRGVDLLLIDDIQFLANKDSTQEEFFHTFNALYDAHKQIVVSSDRPPKEIPTLEERLVSRFDWGLITDIHPPDLETRIAILKKKCEIQELDVPDDVILLIANKIKFNIRELEGALTKTIAFSTLNNAPLTLETAQEALKDIIPKKKPVTIDMIQSKTADYFDLHITDMKKKNRSKNVAIPRQIAMYISRELTEHSLPEIGEAFGGRDHSTIIHAVKKIKKGISEDDNLQRMVEEIKHIVTE